MDSMLLSALVAAVIAAAVVAAYIANSFEQSRQLKLQRLQELRLIVQEAEVFLYKIPSGYLPSEVRQCLIQLLQAKYREILTLDPRNNHIKHTLAALNQLQNEKYSHNPDPAKPIFLDVTTAKKSSEHIKDMTNFLVRLYDQGLLNKERAKDLIEQCKVMYLLVNTETDMIAAKNIAEHGRPQIAALRYAKCTERLSTFASNNEMPNRRQYLEECIKEVYEKIEAVRILVEQTNADKEPDKEWDDYETAQKKEDQWKVKKSYDS